MRTTKDYEKLIIGLEPYDDLIKTNRIPMSSPTYYVEEEGKFDVPKIISRDGWDYHFERNSLYYIFYNFLELGTKKEIDSITDEKYFYVVRITSSLFFLRNENIGFKCVHPKTLEHVKNNKAKIVLVYTDEGHMGLPEFGDCHTILQKWCDELHLPSENIYFITGNMIANKIVSSNIKYNIISLHNWDSLNVPSNYKICEFIPDSDKFLYVNLNRSRYKHRALMLVNLLKENLLDKGMNSFNYENIDVGDTYFPEYLTEDDPQLLNANNEFNKIQVNVLDLPYNHSGLSSVVNTDFYTKTFCSIIPESHYESGIMHFSEKIWKPLMNGHPFFLLGSPNCLEYLRSQGFITFGKWFDESYDQYDDLYERVKIITTNLKRLSEYSLDDLIAIRQEMRPIIEHNYNHLVKTYNEKYIVSGNITGHGRKPHCDILLDILDNWK
jgi:hypothetical protein